MSDNNSKRLQYAEERIRTLENMLLKCVHEIKRAGGDPEVVAAVKSILDLGAKTCQKNADAEVTQPTTLQS